MPTSTSYPPVGRALLDAAEALDRVADSLRAAVTSPASPDEARAEPPAFLSVAEAGRSLRVSRATVNRRIADGTLRSRRVGGRRLIPVAAVLEIGQAAGS